MKQLEVWIKQTTVVEMINPTEFMQCFAFTIRIQRQNAVQLNNYDYYEGLVTSGCPNTK